MRGIDRIAKLERLSSLDSGFLALETPATPMHIGSLVYLDPAAWRDAKGHIRLEAFRALVSERLGLAPRFRQRPVVAPLNLGRPVWLDDPHFDIANHVNVLSLPPPGSDQQLRALCADLMMMVLDRSRPLWEVWLVDGHADGDIVLLEKVHHVMMDGVSGVDIAMLLTDPTAEIGCSVAADRHVRAAGTVELFITGAIDELGVPAAVAGAPFRAAKLLATAVSNPVSAIGFAHELGGLGKGALSLLKRDTLAPRTPLNHPVAAGRVYQHVEWSLDDVRRMAKSFGCTVNDVALAAVTGGIRRLFLDRGSRPSDKFQVAVPVSTRTLAEHMSFGNRVAIFLVPLPVGTADAEEQLETIRKVTRARKDREQARIVASVVGAADRWPTKVVDLLAHLAHHQPFANAVVTNVPGPPVTRYIFGSRIKRIVPLVPLAGNLDLSVGVFSYDGELSFGCLGDAIACPDIDVVTEGIRANLECLSVRSAQATAVQATAAQATASKTTAPAGDGYASYAGAEPATRQRAKAGAA